MILSFLINRCIEVLIDVQVKSRRNMLSDIDALHRAASTAEKRLDFIMKEVSHLQSDSFYSTLFLTLLRNTSLCPYNL